MDGVLIDRRRRKQSCVFPVSQFSVSSLSLNCTSLPAAPLVLSIKSELAPSPVASLPAAPVAGQACSVAHRRPKRNYSPHVADRRTNRSGRMETVLVRLFLQVPVQPPNRYGRLVLFLAVLLTLLDRLCWRPPVRSQKHWSRATGVLLSLYRA
ncbi:hypothetical protein R6Q59_009716 [Mikania micrantha]